MKKARAESITLKRELHKMISAQGSVVFTMLKNLLEEQKKLLPFYLHIRNCLPTLQHVPIKKISVGTFGVVSIGHIRHLNLFVRLSKENILVISMQYLKQECRKVNRLRIFSLHFRCI